MISVILIEIGKKIPLEFDRRFAHNQIGFEDNHYAYGFNK